MLADALGAVADISALAAAIAAVFALYFAWKAVGAARETIRSAEDARIDAERDRERQRLEHIGQVVERVFWMAKGGYDVDTGWVQEGNVLRQALVGLEDELPECAAVPGLSSAIQAKPAASRARDEIRKKLEALSRTPDVPSPPDKG